MGICSEKTDGSPTSSLELGGPNSKDNVADADGKIPVRAYSNAASVELLLNGESLGQKTFTKKQTSDGRTYQEGANANELYLEWKVAYKQVPWSNSS